MLSLGGESEESSKNIFKFNEIPTADILIN